VVTYYISPIPNQTSVLQWMFQVDLWLHVWKLQEGFSDTLRGH
jgi:hypothetical protein